MPLRVAVAGVPGAWSTERMCEALQAEGVTSFSFSLGECLHDLDTGRVTLSGRDLAQLDGVVVKKLAETSSAASRLRLHLLSALEDYGVRIYSRPSVIERVMDRYGMHMELARAGLPLPRTLSFEGTEGMRQGLERLRAAVAKPVYTSKGRGMVRVDHGNGARDVGAWRDDGARMLLQGFIEAPGRDIGACVLGGSYLGAFFRVARDGEWMTTTAAGGTYAPCDLSRRGVELAERAADVFGLDYTVVDLVEAPGGYRMYEVSAFGGFRGLWEASRFDVARRYARYVKRSLVA